VSARAAYRGVEWVGHAAAATAPAGRAEYAMYATCTGLRYLCCGGASPQHK
jgi:hypothetical protein